MPIRQELCPVSRVFRTTITGIVTLEDIRRHVLVVRQVKAHQHPELIDARAVEGLEFGARDLMKVAHGAKEVLGTTDPAARAVVVNELGHFGLARVFASLVAGWMRVGVFEDVEAAEAWLSTQTERSRAN